MPQTPTAAEKRAARRAAIKAYKEAHHRYVVRYQWRLSHPIDKRPRHWTNYVAKASVPILFRTYDAAWEYIDRVGLKGFDPSQHRKLSVAVDFIII